MSAQAKVRSFYSAAVDGSHVGVAGLQILWPVHSWHPPAPISAAQGRQRVQGCSQENATHELFSRASTTVSGQE